ncbi:hypothetical protein LSAT2_029137 [Lamellibrachia satsuma]|nr:hypothetical protein LSAT2_029137 [Lamellibrachia satsuma]
MASAVRHASDVANKRSMQRKRTKLYNALVSSLKKVQVRDITNVNLKLQCLLDVTDIEDDLSNEAKEDVLTMYEDMAKFLLHTAYTIDSKDALTESSELIKKAERALFVGSTGIMKTSMAELGRMERAAGVVDDIEDSYTLKRKADAKAVIIKASSIVNDVISEVALSRQLPR